MDELKKLSEERMLLFDEELMTFAMGNCIALEDTNGNRKLLKKRYEQKIDAVAAHGWMPISHTKQTWKRLSMEVSLNAKSKTD